MFELTKAHATMQRRNASSKNPVRNPPAFIRVIHPIREIRVQKHGTPQLNQLISRA